jgi:hypothetical protein
MTISSFIITLVLKLELIGMLLIQLCHRLVSFDNGHLGN